MPVINKPGEIDSKHPLAPSLSLKIPYISKAEQSSVRMIQPIIISSDGLEQLCASRFFSHVFFASRYYTAKQYIHILAPFFANIE